jgi:carbonic anhydrase
MNGRRKMLALAVIGLGGVLSCLAAGRSGPGPAAVAAGATKKQALTPDAAWQRLKAGNKRFAQDMLERQDLGAKRRQELARGQKPFAIVLTCADSRLTPEYVFDQGLGDLFVVRVAGNVTDPDILASIEFAVQQMHVPLIVLLGHEQCGAVAAALGPERPPGNLGKLLGEIYVGKDLPAGKEAALAAAVQNNVRHHTRLLTERSNIIREHVARGQVRIVSGVYRLAAGTVEWLEGQ